MLQELKNEQTSSKDWSFVYQQYNVLQFNKSPLSSAPRFARILNSFIEGLNAMPKLPKYIFVLPDSDIIEGTGYFDYGVMQMIEEQVQWLFQQMNKYVEHRREDLKLKRAGAIAMSTHEPRFILVAMIDRPFTTDFKLKKILGLKNRFNEVLCVVVEHEKYHYIMHLQLPHNDPLLFTSAGKLSKHGKTAFWLENASTI